jgi:hypothetical protein
MNTSQAIAHMEAAEDLFALLGVAFDPAVLAVHRVAILRRFGQEVAVLERRRPRLTEVERRPLFGAALQRAHGLYALGGGEVEPFLRPRPRDVVPVERLRRATPSADMT